MTRFARALLLANLVALISASSALASAGGGSAGFGGGGGGGGGHGGGEIFFLVWLIAHPVVLGFLIAVALIFIVVSWINRQVIAARMRMRREKRRKRVVLAAAEAAEDDAAFAPDVVVPAAEHLYRTLQAAWSRNDRATLARLVGPDLLREWERRLDDFARRGWQNRVEILGAVKVAYVGLTNYEADEDDRAVVFVAASLRDIVVDRAGRTILRKGSAALTVNQREYWTLGKRDGQWILISIEQEREGEHHLTDALVASRDQDDSLRDEARVEIAQGEKLLEGFSLAEVADLDFDGDARAAALDLSLADGRFAPDVLEIAARRVVTAWASAIDGPDAPLTAVATPAAARSLLYPRGDSSRLVVRGPRIRNLRIVGLDAGSTPPTMTLELEVQGRRYIEDRDTTAVLEGSRDRAVTFTERWTLALGDDERNPWKIAAAGAPAAPART